MKNINEQFEDISFEDTEFGFVDQKYLIVSILIAALAAFCVLGLLFGLLILIF